MCNAAVLIPPAGSLLPCHFEDNVKMERSGDLSESFENLTVDGNGSRKYLDQLRGFAYLETFSEIAAWRDHEVDPLQRANTPLYKRPAVETPDADAKERSRVMLIHDYAGGYHEYESCQGFPVDKELYSCQYLQSVDTFVYFSHKLVTIPPPTWTNTCHRNGVRVLGTFIVEPGSPEVERILDVDESGSFWLAIQLARLADHYGFDGWLVNIECPFPPLFWNGDKLVSFLRQLRSELGSEGKVVWYDALTSLNFVWYQNGLNHLNLSFAMAAGSFVSNYAWTPESALRGVRMAEQSGLGVENLHFGIDVWAQNVQRDPNHRRVTWPNPGGGGTGTGLGMRALQNLRSRAPGVGIFAPAWSFEHFPELGSLVDKSMWLGNYLPSDWSCDCGPTKPHSAVPYQHNGIVRYAERSVVGTDCFFHTDFRGAFTQNPESQNLMANLIAQQPSLLEKMGPLGIKGASLERVGHLAAHIEGPEPRCVLSVVNNSTTGSTRQIEGSIRLFELAINKQRDFLVTINYQRVGTEHCAASLVIETTDRQASYAIDLPKKRDGLSTNNIKISLQDTHICGIRWDFGCENTNILPPGRTPMVEIYSITIQPWLRPPTSCELTDIRAEHRGLFGIRHLRLSWDMEFFPSTSDIPISKVTGPCAFFTVSLDGREMGRAYAMESVVPSCEVEEWETRGASKIEITATGFDGRILARKETFVPWPTDYEVEWVMVSSAMQ